MPAALGPRCARFVGEAAADRVLQAAQIAQGQLQQEHLSVVLPAPDSGCTHKLFMYVCVLLPRALCVCVCVVQERRDLQLALIPSVGSALSLASFSHTEVLGRWSCRNWNK